MDHAINTATLTAEVDVASLDLRPSAKALELRENLVDFMHSHIFPAKHPYEEYRTRAGDLALQYRGGDADVVDRVTSGDVSGPVEQRLRRLLRCAAHRK